MSKVDKNNKKDNKEKDFAHAVISWYPGHMAKTKKQIAEDLKLVDVVIEILDSRIPLSSQNPDIAKVIQGKKKIVILNKCDISDENQNKQWVKYFEDKGIPAVLTDSNSGKGIEECIRKIENVMKEELDKKASKGRIGSKIKAMIIGIPNVGKSSFINRIAKKNSANVGNKPGVTKTKQWIRINEKIELLDTPGVLWPKFEDQSAAIRLAFTGAISDDILDIETLAMKLLSYLAESYPQSLTERYKIEFTSEDDGLALLEKVGKKRGMVISGGEINTVRAAITVLDEFRSGKLGRITLEMPPEKE